jgi:hypothetical protein
MPHPNDVDAGVIVYKVRYANDERAVRFNRRMVVDAMYLPREHYDKLRAVYSRITAADQEQVVLRKAAAKAAAQ